MKSARRGWLWALLAAVLGLGSLGLSETADAQRFRVEIDRPQVRARFTVGTSRRAPPPQRVEVRPAAPQYGMIWQPGYWNYDGRNYAWVEGRYSEQRQGYTWREPRWEQRREGWVLVSGTWIAAAPSSPPPPAYGTPTYPPTSRPGYRPPSDPGRGVMLPRGAAHGEPQSFRAVEGNRGGYWVWIDSQGLFHLHASSNRPRSFQGRIVSDQGAAVRLERLTGTDPDDRTIEDGRGITFDWSTAERGQDGIVFSVQGQCARLHLTSQPAANQGYDNSRGYGDRDRSRGYSNRGQRGGTRIFVGRNQIQVRGSEMTICR